VKALICIDASNYHYYLTPSERLSDTLAGAANQVLFLENIRSDVEQS
jgi:hypothetical protein